jgi:hypothetical protein
MRIVPGRREPDGARRNAAEKRPPRAWSPEDANDDAGGGSGRGSEAEARDEGAEERNRLRVRERRHEGDPMVLAIAATGVPGRSRRAARRDSGGAAARAVLGRGRPGPQGSRQSRAAD